jgi:hypothetical protein
MSEIYFRNQNIITVHFAPELTQTVTQSMYISADCYLQTDTVPVMFSVLFYSTFTAQILLRLYSLQLNCTYSNYTKTAATYSATSTIQHKICPADVF